MKRVSDSGETPVVIPVVLEPVEVQVPVQAIVPEIRNVTVAVRITPELYKMSPAPLLLEYS